MNKFRATLFGSFIMTGLLFVAGPVLVPADADAERPKRTHRMRWMAGPEAPWISLTLKHRADLNLTSDQVSTLEQMRSEFEQQAAPIQSELRNVEREIVRLLRESPVDLAQARVRIEESEKLRSELRYLRIEALDKGKAVLTTDQKDRLKELVTSSHRQHRRPQSRGEAS
jgi:Spy/CpxP family protein refolding chaperone